MALLSLSQAERSPAAGSSWHKGQFSTQCDLPEAWGSLTYPHPGPRPCGRRAALMSVEAGLCTHPIGGKAGDLKHPLAGPLPLWVWGRNPETILNHQESSTLVKR